VSTNASPTYLYVQRDHLSAHPDGRIPMTAQEETRLVTPADAARQVCVSVGALAQLRYLGTGPRFVKLGVKTVRYRQQDLDEWIEKSLRDSTGAVG
jgi:predicted DNA-binding transcriptional regulator AlpA